MTATTTDEWERSEGVACVSCPRCLFTFAAEHTDDGEPSGTYSCPSCDEAETAQVLRKLIHDQMGADFTEPEVGGAFAVCWRMNARELARFLAAELREPGSWSATPDTTKADQ